RPVQALAEARAHGARDDVDARAGREGHDQLERRAARLRRLRRGGQGGGEGQRGERGTQELGHGWRPFPVGMLTSMVGGPRATMRGYPESEAGVAAPQKTQPSLSRLYARPGF